MPEFTPGISPSLLPTSKLYSIYLHNSRRRVSTLSSFLVAQVAVGEFPRDEAARLLLRPDQFRRLRVRLAREDLPQTLPEGIPEGQVDEEVRGAVDDDQQIGQIHQVDDHVLQLKEVEVGLRWRAYSRPARAPNHVQAGKGPADKKNKQN